MKNPFSINTAGKKLAQGVLAQFCNNDCQPRIPEGLEGLGRPRGETSRAPSTKEDTTAKNHFQHDCIGGVGNTPRTPLVARPEENNE